VRSARSSSTARPYRRGSPSRGSRDSYTDRDRGDDVAFILGAHAFAPFEQALGTRPASVDPARASATLADRDALITASTCWGDRIEAKAVLVARDGGVPILTFVDFWSNYASRLSYPDEANLALLPDRLAVIDATMADDIVAVGAPRDRIVVTGSPAFDAIKPLPFPEGASTLLFLSQPLAALYGDTLGYSEQTVLPLVASIARDNGTPLRIRTHPREDATAMRALARGLPGDVAIDEHASLEEAVASSSVVVGMSSMGLVEAALWSRISISAQIGRRGDDALPTNRTGLTSGVTSEAELAELLGRSLRDPKPSSVARFMPRATERLIDAFDDLARARTRRISAPEAKEAS
jgi:hypothetical protein